MASSTTATPAYQQKLTESKKRKEESERILPTDAVEIVYLDKDVLRDLKMYYGDIEDSYSDVIRKLMQVADGKRKRSTVIEPKSQNRLPSYYDE